jgi:hypothetical protein
LRGLPGCMLAWTLGTYWRAENGGSGWVVGKPELGAEHGFHSVTFASR